LTSLGRAAIQGVHAAGEEVYSEPGVIGLLDKGDPGSQSEDLATTPELVRSQLKKLITSRFFRSSALQKQFLEFVVRKTLEGKTGEINEYPIGADAFGRGQDCQPASGKAGV
jgi:hypothetical protein